MPISLLVGADNLWFSGCTDANVTICQDLVDGMEEGMAANKWAVQFALGQRSDPPPPEEFLLYIKPDFYILP